MAAAVNHKSGMTRAAIASSSVHANATDAAPTLEQHQHIRLLDDRRSGKHDHSDTTARRKRPDIHPKDHPAWSRLRQAIGKPFMDILSSKSRTRF